MNFIEKYRLPIITILLGVLLEAGMFLVFGSKHPIEAKIICCCIISIAFIFLYKKN
jgi:uncharacterized membrane protein